MWSKVKGLRLSAKWIVLLTVFMTSGWIYSQYSYIEKMELRNHAVNFNSWYFDDLNQIRGALSYELLLEKYGDDSAIFDSVVQMTGRTLEEWDFSNWENNPSDKSFENLTDEELEELTLLFVTQQLEGIVRDYQNILDRYQNLQFAVIDHKSGIIIHRGESILKELAKDVSIDGDLEDNLRSDFQHMVIFDMNEGGRMSVPFAFDRRIPNATFEFIDGVNVVRIEQSTTSVFDSLTSNTRREMVVHNPGLDFSYYELSPLTNTTFVFGIPNTLTYDDTLLWNFADNVFWGMRNTVLGYGLFLAAFVGIVAFFVPIRKVNKWKFMSWMLKFPIEIMPFFIFGVLVLFLEIIPSVAENTIWNSTATFTFSPILSIENIEALLTLALNVGLWCAFFGAVAYSVLYIKNLFKQGIKKSLRNNSFIIGNILKVYDFFAIDLKDPGVKTLFLLVFFQGLVICLISLPLGAISPQLYFLTVIAIGIYSVLLFFILRRKLTTIQKHYLRLFEVTTEMSNGNLDVQIEEDLGMFESIKDQLSQIKNGFKKAVENETTSQRMKTDLIANVSHDLKTPLTSIITYVDLLKDESLDAQKRHQYLATLDQKSHRLKELIEDLFEMSKVSSGDIKLDLQEIDVVSLMKQTLMELEDRIDEVNLIIRPNFPDEKVKLMLDGGRTYRVFENLILNMVKYALPNTRAYIDIIENEEQVTIMLRNISATEINVNMNELTERFVRGDQSRTTEGSGLGLAIAKSIVELQDGTFNVQVDGDLFKVIMIFNK